MLIVKTNPVGRDKEIQRIQARVYHALVSAWGLTDDDTVYECYGRCYKNKEKNGYVAEVFTAGKDYKEVYWNDNLRAISFFREDDKVENALGEGKTRLALIFFVDLSKLKPSIAHRADEEVRLDVIKLFGLELESVETGVDNVLREFSGTRKTDLAIKGDQHPVHCFRLNLNIIFQNC
jgi:hypothetical protein